MTNPDLDRELDAVVEQHIETAMVNRELCAGALRCAFLLGRASAFEEVLRHHLGTSVAKPRAERPS